MSRKASDDAKKLLAAKGSASPLEQTDRRVGDVIKARRLKQAPKVAQRARSNGTSFTLI